MGRCVSLIERNGYVKMVVGLSEHYEDEYNAVKEMMKFGELRQQKDEKSRDFIVRFRGQAAICDFSDKEREVLIQFVQHSTDENVKLMYDRNQCLALEELVEAVVRNETTAVNVSNQ